MGLCKSTSSLSFRGNQCMENIKFVYTENGKEKSSLDEHRRRCEIMEHNQRLQKEYPVYIEQKDKDIEI